MKKIDVKALLITLTIVFIVGAPCVALVYNILWPIQTVAVLLFCLVFILLYNIFKNKS